MIPMAVICLVWCLACLGLWGAGRVLPVWTFRAFEYVSIGTCLYAGALILKIYLTRIEPLCKTRPFLRGAWLGILGLLFGIGYGLAAAGLRSVFLSGSHTLVLLLFASVLGTWLSTHLKRPPEIVAVGVTAGLADLFSVFKGPTKAMSENIAAYYGGGMDGLPPFVDFVLVKIPMPGGSFMPVFGITDWILIAFLSAAALKFNMTDNILELVNSTKKNRFLFFPATCGGLAAAIFFAREAHVFLPALPFAVFVYLIFMLVKYPEMRWLTKAELIPMISVSALLIGLMLW